MIQYYVIPVFAIHCILVLIPSHDHSSHSLGWELCLILPTVIEELETFTETNSCRFHP